MADALDPNPIADILSHAQTGHGISLEADEVRILAREIDRLLTIEARAWSAHGAMDSAARQADHVAAQLRERNAELRRELDPPSTDAKERQGDV